MLRLRGGGKVHGSLARAGKVKGQTPKVEKQEKRKTPRGRAKKRILYSRRFLNVATGVGGKRLGPNSNAGAWTLRKLNLSCRAGMGWCVFLAWGSRTRKSLHPFPPFPLLQTRPSKPMGTVWSEGAGAGRGVSSVSRRMPLRASFKFGLAR